MQEQLRGEPDREDGGLLGEPQHATAGLADFNEPEMVERLHETPRPEDAVTAAREMGALFGRFGDVGAASGLIGFDIGWLTDNIAEFVAVATRDVLAHAVKAKDVLCEAVPDDRCACDDFEE